MVDLLTGVLVGIVLYTVVAMALQANGYLPDSVKVSGPITTIHTQRGRALLNRLARRKRFWRAWTNMGVGVILVVMVLSGIFVVLSMVLILSQPESATIESPQNVLVIPGVNDFLPLSAAVEIIFGLLVGLVVHEGGHGLLCRVEDIEIESMGLALFAFVPLGAFVEPDPEDQDSANRGAQTRMFAAGITNNFVVTLLSLVVLVVLVSFVGVAPGAPVGDTLPGSGAQEAGIERGDVITGINGTTVENTTEFQQALRSTDSAVLSVSRNDGEDVTVERRLLITRAVSTVISGIEIGGGEETRIQSVNGTAVNTEAAFDSVVRNRSIASIKTNRGNATVPIGAYVFHVRPDGPMADAGGPANGTMIVTHVGGTRVANASAYQSAVSDLSPGDTVTVRAAFDGQAETLNVTVGGTPDAPDLGVRTEDGYSGMVFDDFGVDTYPASGFLAMLGGNGLPEGVSGVSSFLWYQIQLLILPFATLVIDGLSYNFAGFTSDISGFYVVEGPLSFAKGGVLFAANLAFWTWWINFNLALFNCIPAYPLDGGHLLRTSTESLVSRLPTSRGRTIVTAITVSVTLVMGGALAVLVFGPVFLT